MVIPSLVYVENLKVILYVKCFNVTVMRCNGYLMNLVVRCVTDSDGFEFMVVSLDNSTWHFEAQSQEVCTCIDDM